MKNNLTEGKKPFIIIFAAALLAILIPAAASVSAAEALPTHSFIIETTSNWDEITAENKVASFEDYRLTLYFDTTDSGYVAVTWCPPDEAVPEPPAGMLMLGRPFFFTTADTLRNFNVRLEMNYQPFLPLQNIDESTLRLYRYNEAAGQWALCGDTEAERGVDLQSKIVWAELNGFSRFGVFGEEIIAAPPEEGEAPPEEAEAPPEEGEAPQPEKPLPRTDGTIYLLLAAALLTLTGALLLTQQRGSRAYLRTDRSRQL